MKILTTVFYVVFISTSIKAQATQSAAATANLIIPISITSMEGDLDFGEIILTGSTFTESIDPLNGKRFVITGHPDRNISIVFNPIALVNNSPYYPDETLLFSPEVKQSGGGIIASGDTKILISNGSTGELELWVGGSISIASDQAQGDYVGTFTITVSY